MFASGNSAPPAVARVITVSITNDAAVEDDESFTLTLSSGDPDAAMVNASVATITILDDDGECTHNKLPLPKTYNYDFKSPLYSLFCFP